jgi:hypothetical protein
MEKPEMFRNTAPAAEPAPDVDVVMDPAGLVPLSVLALDLPEPPGGWPAYLASRGVPVLTDDIGRLAIARAEARQLLDEQREAEAHAREVAARQEREAVERDRAVRAALPTGLHWTDIPAGVSAAELWAAHEKDSQPKRRSVLEHALSNTGEMVFHPIGPTLDENAS